MLETFGVLLGSGFGTVISLILSCVILLFIVTPGTDEGGVIVGAMRYGQGAAPGRLLGGGTLE